ncbi:hypothetical protein ABZT51_07410 [Streptomyces sp. NPDC005373]|uniref:hypothetical protein n=1 Tax=Streptomyces sp. NPDC005373 TaxID=3156879 RepID=UPI0033B3BE2C
MFDRTVHAGRTPLLQQTHFLAAVARVESKSFEQRCRLHVPGMAAETLQGYVTELPPVADAVAADPPPTPPGSGTTMQFLGSMKDTNVIGSVGTYYHNSPGR